MTTIPAQRPKPECTPMIATARVHFNNRIDAQAPRNKREAQRDDQAANRILARAVANAVARLRAGASVGQVEWDLRQAAQAADELIGAAA